MFARLNSWVLKTYLRFFGRSALNKWVLSNFETMPTKVMDFANAWVADHVDRLVRRLDCSIEVPNDWSDQWRTLLTVYMNENGLTVIDVDDQMIVAWHRTTITYDLSGVGLVWNKLLACAAEKVDAEKYAASIFAETIAPKLSIGEVVYVSATVWAEYGEHLNRPLKDMLARVRYDGGKERYVITIPHKAPWEDAPLYNNPVDGYEYISDEDIGEVYGDDESWDEEVGEDVDLDSD